MGHGIVNTPPPQAWLTAHRLALQLLDPLRDRFGPLRVTSWYRSQPLNVLVGGSPRSYHLIGAAADIVPTNASCVEVMRWVEQSALPFDSVIYEQSKDSEWLHVQCSRSLAHKPRSMLLTKRAGQPYTGWAS